VDIPRQPPEDDPQIKSRVDTAGRFGFVLGCVAAIAAITINFYRSSSDWSLLSTTTAVLMAALNVPLGIMLGLWGEKLTRPKRPKGKHR
jgi:hypothetical protein